MEQIHYCSPDRDCFSAIVLSLGSGLYFIFLSSGVSSSFRVRCIGQKKSFNDVTIDD